VKDTTEFPTQVRASLSPPTDTSTDQLYRAHTDQLHRLHRWFQTLPQATLNVDSTNDVPDSGRIVIITHFGITEVSYRAWTGH
jgi:hypothetical protein